MAQLQFIAECFRFPVSVRSAKYTGEHIPARLQGVLSYSTRARRTIAEVMKEFEVVCAHSLNTCPFSFVLNGFSGPAGTAENTQEYSIAASCWEHNHEPQLGALRRTLLLAVTDFSKHLFVESMISPPDIVRVIRSKYGIAVEEKTMYNVLNFHRSTLYPANRDAAGILQRLRTLQLEHPKAFYDVETDKEYRLQNLCFALPGWQDE